MMQVHGKAVELRMSSLAFARVVRSGQGDCMMARMKTALVLFVLLAGLGWVFRDSPAVREWVQPVMSSGAARWVGEQAATVGGTVNTARGAQGASGARSAGGLRKCVGSAGIIYTNGECPPGTRRQDVDGAVTVLPAQRADPSTAAASAAPRSPLEEMAGPPIKGTLKDKYIENIR
jgi:hypothetical protein